ncbi:MAG TPA: hypothetical protein VG498_07925 [Terriglobales bacterium]|nr:hypothetical protein [Terriglobales bacterium]
MVRKSTALVLVTLFVTVAVAQNAQSPQKSTDETGWTSSMNLDGSANSQERVMDLDSSVGYNFDKHWGVDMEVPLSFVSSSSSASSTTGSNTGKNNTSLNSLGNVRTDLNFKSNGKEANYTSTLTAAAPTGSTTKGVSTGRPNFGWNNRVEHCFDPLTPFLEAGFSNGLTDTKLFHRPFTTLGFVSQFTGGSTIDIGGNFSVGASLYDVLPSGQQKMFSKLIAKNSAAPAGTGKNGRAYELTAETTGDASLTRDNGGSIWAEFSPGAFDLQVGYTHSVHLALNTVAFNVGLNLGKLVRSANK